MSNLAYDEKNPAPLGHRLARPYVSWMSYVVMVIGIPISIVLWLYLLEWCTSFSLTIPILILVYMLITLGFFLLNALWWGAQYRDRLTTSNGKGDGMDAVSGDDCSAEEPDENLMRDRLLRLNQDQWYMSSLLIMLLVLEVFLTIFLGTSGLDTYAPFPAVFGNGFFVRNNIIMKIFYGLFLGTIGASFMILMYTGSDYAYRQAYAASADHFEEHGHQIPVNNKKMNKRHKANDLDHDD